MKKLYLATRKRDDDVMFVSDDLGSKTGQGIYGEATYWLNEQADFYDGTSDIDVTEITDYEQIPSSWKDDACFIWGVEDEEMTADDFLKRSKEVVDPEYQEYLRLKAKFE